MLLGMSKIGAGLLAATLTLGGGSALAASAHGAAATKTAPNAATRQAACQQYQTQLAQNLHITLAQLQDAQKQTKNQEIDARLAAGTITADQAKRAHDRVNAGTGACATPQANTTRREAAVRIGKGELAAVAQLLKIDEKTLVLELRGGKSLAQVASAHNVSRDTLKATMRTALKTELDARVRGGTITQAQEDKALTAFDARIDTLIDRAGHAKK
jgi:DNA-binding CsgD family transcriptional regulator